MSQACISWLMSAAGLSPVFFLFLSHLSVTQSIPFVVISTPLPPISLLKYLWHFSVCVFPSMFMCVQLYVHMCKHAGGDQ